MRNYWLICLYLLLVPVVTGHSNNTVVDRLIVLIKQVQDAYQYHLLGQYAYALRLEKPKALKEMSHHLGHKSYVASTIDMVALVHTGPQKGLALMQSISDSAPSLVDKVDEQCVQSTINLFLKSCGVLTQVEMVRNMRYFQNMCKYASEMKAIKEAMRVACGSDIIEPSVIDVENPRIDVIPTQTSGSLDLCKRVSIPGVSRMNLQSYAKAYRLVFDPLWIPLQSLHLIQICIHRNSSRGLCECEEDDWKPIQINLHGSMFSPFQQLYVDVKFSGRTSGFVAITLDEVSQGHWRYQFLAAGIISLFLASLIGEVILGENISNGVDKFIRWTVRIFAVACIYQSSIDTLLALVAIGSAVTLYYLICSIVRFGAGMNGK